MVRYSSKNSQVANGGNTPAWAAQEPRAQAQNIAVARGRARCYLILSRLYERELDGPLWHALVNGELIEAGRALGFTPAMLDFASSESAALEALAVDYCQLFIGPGGHRPPYQSIWEGEPQLWGQAAVSVARFLSQLQLKVPEACNEQPDHLWIILAIMAHLCENEATAHSAGDEALLEAAMTLEYHCLTHHIINWVPKFTRWLQETAEQPLYRQLARATREFLTVEARRAY